jgi:hypothetical protein
VHDGINRGLTNVDTVVMTEREKRDTMRRHAIDEFEDTMIIGCV